MEQMTLFKLAGPTWDDDLNALHADLLAFAARWGMETETKWGIWGHTPKYGYRLTVNLKFLHMDKDREDAMTQELQAICAKGKPHKIDLSPYWGANKYIRKNAERNGWDTSGYEYDDISVYSTFEDEKRRKKR